jgi:hypothetical protein
MGALWAVVVAKSEGNCEATGNEIEWRTVSDGDSSVADDSSSSSSGGCTASFSFLSSSSPHLPVRPGGVQSILGFKALFLSYNIAFYFDLEPDPSLTTATRRTCSEIGYEVVHRSPIDSLTHHQTHPRTLQVSNESQQKPGTKIRRTVIVAGGVSARWRGDARCQERR